MLWKTCLKNYLKSYTLLDTRIASLYKEQTWTTVNFCLLLGFLIVPKM